MSFWQQSLIAVLFLSMCHACGKSQQEQGEAAAASSALPQNWSGLEDFRENLWIAVDYSSSSTLRRP